jgi:hypothetical protein
MILPVKPDVCFCVDCRTCKRIHFVKLVESDYESWQKGELIQNAFPYLSTDDRELLQTQLCGKCFNNLFEEGTDEKR